MKSYKNFDKSETEHPYVDTGVQKSKLPSAIIRHGSHATKSFRKKKGIPSEIVRQGEHSKKSLKEDVQTSNTSNSNTSNNNEHLKAKHPNFLSSLDKLSMVNAHIGSNVDEQHVYLHNKAEKNEHRHVNYEHVYNYTMGSKGINTELFNSHVENRNPNMEKYQQERIKGIDSVLNDSKLDHDLHVFSGVGFHPDTIQKTDDNKRLLHLPSYTSTSISPRVASTFAKHFRSDTKEKVPDVTTDFYESTHPVESHVLKIKVPAGHRGVYIGEKSDYPSEHEFLLPRKVTLHIHDDPETYDNDMHDLFKRKLVKVWRAEIIHHPDHNPDEPLKFDKPKDDLDN